MAALLAESYTLSYRPHPTPTPEKTPAHLKLYFQPNDTLGEKRQRKPVKCNLISDTE